MKIKNCSYCQKPYEWSRGMLYCSKECKIEAKTPQARACQICKKEFRPSRSNPNARFCSAQCRQESRRVVFPIECKICRVTFQPRSKHVQCCSLDCRNKLISQINRDLKPLAERVCKHCGKSFKVRPSRIGPSEDSAAYCSRACYSQHRIMPRVQVNCGHCGQAIEKAKHLFLRAKVQYCSVECHAAAIYSPRELIKCPECKKVFEDKKTRNRKFCSPSCKGIYMAKTGAFSQKATSIENKIEGVLSTMSVIYLKQFKVGFYVCDFYIPAANLIIECDGDYWHSRPEVAAKDKRKDAFLKKRKYSILRLPEWKINNHIDECSEEIKQLLTTQPL